MAASRGSVANTVYGSAEKTESRSGCRLIHPRRRKADRTSLPGDRRYPPSRFTESPYRNVSGRAQGLCGATAGERDAGNAGPIEHLVISPREMEPSGAPPFAGLRPRRRPWPWSTPAGGSALTVSAAGCTDASSRCPRSCDTCARARAPLETHAGLPQAYRVAAGLPVAGIAGLRWSPAGVVWPTRNA